MVRRSAPSWYHSCKSRLRRGVVKGVLVMNVRKKVHRSHVHLLLVTDGFKADLESEALSGRTQFSKFPQLTCGIWATHEKTHPTLQVDNQDS